LKTSSLLEISDIETLSESIRMFASDPFRYFAIMVDRERERKRERRERDNI
jgi:hypothetical protein